MIRTCFKRSCSFHRRGVPTPKVPSIRTNLTLQHPLAYFLLGEASNPQKKSLKKSAHSWVFRSENLTDRAKARCRSWCTNPCRRLVHSCQVHPHGAAQHSPRGRGPSPVNDKLGYPAESRLAKSYTHNIADRELQASLCPEIIIDIEVRKKYNSH